MSETFLIKKTIFDSSGSITEKSDNSFIIGPGELNGPGGIARNSDLQLYGLGSLKWGEGVNQNIFRLLENNSCEAKVLGDWLPGGTQLLADYIPATSAIPAGNGEYDPNIHLILPKDEYDLGIGNGITTPVVGQNWYNFVNTLTYTFNGTDWKTVVNDDGSLSLTGLLDMGGFEIINLKDPVANQDGVNLQYADANYVNVSGDTMTGDLTLSGVTQLSLLNGQNPVNGNNVTNKTYNDNTYVERIGSSMSGPLVLLSDLTVQGSVDFGNTPTVGTNDVWHAGNDGPGSTLDADTVDGSHLSDIIDLIYPVGSVYMSVNNINPTTLFGGTWVQYAEGRTIVGQKPSDPLFGTVGNAGGNADAVNVAHNHLASVTDPGHVHSVKKGFNDAANPIVGFDNATNYSADQNTESALTGISVSISSNGVSGTNANLQPYIVTYIWERTG